MNGMHILIEQMASDISRQAARLDEVRLQLFLNWLNAHSSKVKTITSPNGQAGEQIEFQCEMIDEYLKNGLIAWFASFSIEGLLWEYRLILDEINWWRILDDQVLLRILNRAKQEVKC